MIEKYDVEKGYKDGAIQLIESPHGDGTVCRIGEYWFYFGGRIAEGCSPMEYKKRVSEKDIIQVIYDTLDKMRTSRDVFNDEYDYYESVLNKVFSARIRVRAYNRAGDIDQDYFFTDIRNALKKYVEFRDSIPDYKRNKQYWPTIWVRTDKGFWRVHDFAFWELTDENIERYLAERILDSDEMLAEVV